ncbi:Na-translocating system protein MpsC family protein [Janibacter melonis]|uniref:Na-translocating system protein MpsC family protein n=1 Tax=Janibacter melonis TaxID=262209 RepID=UPI00174D08EE|nr:Na-translocating system protein MpsC family protein [Janibacter melonis]
MSATTGDRPVPAPAHRASPRPLGEWKQEILRVYNQVNKEVAGLGVTRQRVHVEDDHLLVVATHHRLPALATITAADPSLGRRADVAVIDAGKALLRARLVDELGIGVLSVLKDYDPVAEVAATVVLLGAPLPVTGRGASRGPDDTVVGTPPMC